MYNNAFVLDKLDKLGEEPDGAPHRGPAPRRLIKSSPCLLQRLPSTGLQMAYS